MTLATYSFFAAGIFGRQSIGDTATDFPADIYFPSWTVLQLLFYMGLLKVAENMVNPYGIIFYKIQFIKSQLLIMKLFGYFITW